MSQVVVDGPTGPIIGTASGGVADYPGVAYAHARRFAEAGEPHRAQGPATAFPQRPGMLDALLGRALGEAEQSEDSFSLRIQAPVGASNAPVIVFIPGGAFVSGSAHARWFTSPHLVREGPVVLVTVNHRLGALGTLGFDADGGTAPGLPDAAGSPLALSDLVQAIRWVHATIGLFGGDPNNVIVAGDSAGAWLAYALARLPELAGLVSAALLISLPRLDPLSPADDDARRAAFLDAFGPAADLPQAPVSRILDAQVAAGRAYRGRGFPFAPATGPRLPAWLAHYDRSAPQLHVSRVLQITTTEESAAFLHAAPRDGFDQDFLRRFADDHFADPAAALAYARARRPGASAYRLAVDLGTLHQFRLPALEIAQATRQAGIATQVLRFGVQSRLDSVFSPHCMVLPFLFGGLPAWHDAPMLAGIDPAQFEDARRALTGVVLDFARGAVMKMGDDPHTPARRATRLPSIMTGNAAPYGTQGGMSMMELDEAGLRDGQPDEVEQHLVALPA